MQGMEQFPDPGVIFKRQGRKKQTRKEKKGRLERVEPGLSNTRNNIEAENKKSKSVLRQRACKWVYSGKGKKSQAMKGAGPICCT